MEDAIAAAEATLEALVKAAEDFAVPLIAEQRAVLAAADAKAGDAPPDSEYGKARAEFEKKIDELDGALTSAVEKERAEIGVVAKAARSDPSAGDEGADAATVVASVFDPAREHLGERLRGSRSAAEKMLQWLEGRASDLDRAAAAAAAKPPDAPDADADAAADADDAKNPQDWAADDESDLEDLPPLGGDWAEDDEDDLPPLEGEWQKDAEAGPNPNPPSPKKKAAAFKPRDASPPRGNAWGHSSQRDAPMNNRGPPPGRDVDLRDRLGGGGDRRSSYDRGPGQDYGPTRRRPGRGRVPGLVGSAGRRLSGRSSRRRRRGRLQGLRPARRRRRDAIRLHRAQGETVRPRG